MIFLTNFGKMFLKQTLGKLWGLNSFSLSQTLGKMVFNDSVEDLFMIFYSCRVDYKVRSQQNRLYTKSVTFSRKPWYFRGPYFEQLYLHLIEVDVDDECYGPMIGVP